MNYKVYILMIFSFLLFGVYQSQGAIWCNDIIEGFLGPDSENIENTIIEGSSLFFQGMSGIMNLFDEGERGVKTGNFPHSLNLIESALDKFQGAREKYLQAVQLAKAVDKRMCNFTYLEKFNYDQYIIDKGLNPGIANDVKKYLSAGDVVGFYQEVADNMGILVDKLEALRQKFSSRPSLYQEEYWDLLQQCSRIMLFGNYGTVFGKAAYNN